MIASSFSDGPLASGVWCINWYHRGEDVTTGKHPDGLLRKLQVKHAKIQRLRLTMCLLWEKIANNIKINIFFQDQE